MKDYFSFLLLCIFFSVQAQIVTKNKNYFLNTDTAFKSQFETELSDIFKSYKIKGDLIIGIVDETGLVYSYALNKEILQGKSSSLNNDSPIYIASHTKAMTGTLLKILEEEKLIDLNKTLYDYLPELTFKKKVNTKSITVKNLLNHSHGISSGIVIYKTAYFGYSGNLNELIKDFNQHAKVNSSKKFNYSNIGPILAAMIIERVTGNSWKEEMKKRIFEPIGMTNSSTNISDYKFTDIRPSIRVSSDNKAYAGFHKKDITMHAAGGVLSTMNDLSKWLQANINQSDKIFKSKTSWNDLHQPTTTQDRAFFAYRRFGYSLGWDIATYQKDTILTRFGGYDNISFHLSFIPSKKVGVIAFTNGDDTSTLTHLAANYAYNLISKNANVERRLTLEKAPLIESFNKNQKGFSKGMIDKLELSDENDKLIGLYKNKDSWPDIIISKDNLGYHIKWGILPGYIYTKTEGKKPYMASFEVLSRSMSVKKDRLSIGSLTYKRVDAKN